LPLVQRMCVVAFRSGELAGIGDFPSSSLVTSLNCFAPEKRQMMGKGIRHFLYRAMATLLLVVGLPAASIGGYWGWLQYEGNIHVVREGLFYRSAQLGNSDLARAVKEHGIKAILNLRGANPGSPWYDDELALSKKLGIAHYDYALSARRRVDHGEIEKILAIIRGAPKPILVHCKAGADRTGLVSAAYLLMVDGDDPVTADQQLSMLYGHFPYLGSRTSAMDQSFEALVHGATGSTRSLNAERQWSGGSIERP
jgi:protein tyrosine phosphatase (PTP) superfamily phosphohydrolase (DUF442 family)